MRRVAERAYRFDVARHQLRQGSDWKSRPSFRLPIHYQSQALEAEVGVIEVAGDWYVRIVDRHGRQTVNIFPAEDLAIAYAENQLHRLGW